MIRQYSVLMYLSCSDVCCVCLMPVQGSWQGMWPEYFFAHLMEAFMHMIMINVLMLITLAILHAPFGQINRKSKGAPAVSDDIAEMFGWGKQVGAPGCGGRCGCVCTRACVCALCQSVTGLTECTHDACRPD